MFVQYSFRNLRLFLKIILAFLKLFYAEKIYYIFSAQKQWMLFNREYQP